MKRFLLTLILWVPFLMYGKGGIPNATYPNSAEQNRYAVIAPGDSNGTCYCYRIDTKTGEVFYVEVTDKGVNTPVRLNGNDISDGNGKNGRFQAYHAPFTRYNIVLLDTETGRMWQSDREKKTLVEFKFE